MWRDCASQVVQTQVSRCKAYQRVVADFRATRLLVNFGAHNCPPVLAVFRPLAQSAFAPSKLGWLWFSGTLLRFSFGFLVVPNGSLGAAGAVPQIGQAGGCQSSAADVSSVSLRSTIHPPDALPDKL